MVILVNWNKSGYIGMNQVVVDTIILILLVLGLNILAELSKNNGWWCPGSLWHQVISSDGINQSSLLVFHEEGAIYHCLFNVVNLLRYFLFPKTIC